jgi:hypothetical protein
MILPRMLSLLLVSGIAFFAEASELKEPLRALCDFEPPAQVVSLFNDVPEPVRQFLVEKFNEWGGIGFTEEEVELTDVIVDDSLKRRLFSGAVKSGHRWAIWYLRGGKWISVHVGLFELTEDGASLVLTRNVTTVPGTDNSLEKLCGAVQRFLAGSSDMAGARDADAFW